MTSTIKAKELPVRRDPVKEDAPPAITLTCAAGKREQQLGFGKGYLGLKTKTESNWFFNEWDALNRPRPFIYIGWEGLALV
jgi:hypothetical protein